MAVILLPVFANAQSSPAPQSAAQAPQPAASGAQAQNASAADRDGKNGEEEKPSGEEHVSVSIKIYRWSFANSISMPDFGTGMISSRRTASDDSNLWYKSGGKWIELNIAPRQMKTIKYEGPKNMRCAKRKENPPNPDKPEADENFSSAGVLNIPISSGDLFALMLKTGSNARFYPMNISPQLLPRNKFSVQSAVLYTWSW